MVKRWETSRRYALAYPDNSWYSAAGPTTRVRDAALRMSRDDAVALAGSLRESVMVRPVTIGTRVCPSCNGEGYWLVGSPEPDGYERCSKCEGLSWV